MNKPISEGIIDLPPPPMRISLDDGPLFNSDVCIHLLNGEKHLGKLQHLSAALGNLSIEDEHNGQFIDLAFTGIRYVEFKHEVPVTEQLNKLLGSNKAVVFAPGSKLVQEFQVTFTDHGRIHGKTYGSFVDQSGLHFFKPAGEHLNSVTRLFIPGCAVQTYQIGPLLGESLKQRGASAHEDINHALSQQQVQRSKKIGEYLLEDAALKSEDLKKAIDRQRTSFDGHSTIQTSKLGEILLSENTVTPQQLEKSLVEQAKQRGKKLGKYLEDSGSVNSEELHLTIAQKLGIPFVKLADFDIEPGAIAAVPADVAIQHHLIPLCFYHDRLVIALDDPTNAEAIDVVQFIAGRNLELAIATHEDIKNAINDYYGIGSIDDDILEAKDTQAITQSTQELESHEAERLGKEKPIVRLVNKVIMDAIHRRASDIHIRPLDEQVDLLFRIDGSLLKIRSFHKGLLGAVISRIKIIGRMNIAEKRLPQDGRARVSHNNGVVDLRISIIPTVTGESAVIRLLNTQTGLKSIKELGFTPHDTEVFQDMLHKSYGMILVTGPTGSGKSTTLYAALQQVIERNVNIITVEDPVEYHINGIEQIQVNTVPGYTFARALRNILRHDPDVIMVGEIRDQETGKIAVESALTGHLVLSTLHTNNAASAVTRLLEMGIEPFLINDTILGIVAQRLVRRNCPHCVDEEEVEPYIRKALNVEEEEVFYKGHGCNKCNNTGYSGRIAVYELLQMTSQLKAEIKEGVSVDRIYEKALETGMTPLTKHALSQARQRVTSLEEVYRIRLQ